MMCSKYVLAFRDSQKCMYSQQMFLSNRPPPSVHSHSLACTVSKRSSLVSTHFSSISFMIVRVVKHIHIPRTCTYVWGISRTFFDFLDIDIYFKFQ